MNCCCHNFVPFHESHILAGIVKGLKNSRPSLASAYDTHILVASNDDIFLSRNATSLLLREVFSSAANELTARRFTPSEMKGIATKEFSNALRGILSIPRDIIREDCSGDAKLAAE